MADNTWVIVGRLGRLATSDDAITWVSRTSGSSFDLNAVAVSNHRWLTIDDNTKVLYSPTGVNWTTTNGTTTDIAAFAWNGSIWVAVDFDAQIWTSPDGLSWTQRVSGVESQPLAFLRDVTWDSQNGQFVAVGDYNNNGTGILLVSGDGITWTQLTAPFTGVRAVAAGAGAIVVASNLGTFGSSPNKVASSTDGGFSWTTHSVPFTDSQLVQALFFGGGLFLVGGTGGVLATSPDGETWTQQTSGFNSGGTISGIGYGAGTWAIAGRSDTSANASYGQLMTSTDGVTWTERSSTFTAAAFQAVGIFGIAYGQSLLSFNADSVIKKNISASISADAVLTTPIIQANAVIKANVAHSFAAHAAIAFNLEGDTTGRNPHDRDYLHFGDMPATVVAHDPTTSVEAWLREIWDRISAHESDQYKRATFTAHATVFKVVASIFRIDAVTTENVPTFSVDALVKRIISGSFVADAIKVLEGYSFTADGILKRTVTGSFTADAVVGTVEGESGLLGDHVLGQHELGGE